MPTIRLPAGGWRPRAYQLPLWRWLERGGKRAECIWHRRSGKDEVALHWAATAAFERPATYWHMLPEAAQARRAIWEAVNPHSGKRRIDEAFPHGLRETTRENEMMIRFKSGSALHIVGSDNFNSLVGSPPAGVVFSEWALADPAAWGFLRPILAENNGWALFITTPRGNNHAKTMFDAARADGAWFTEILPATETDVFTAAQLETEKREYMLATTFHETARTMQPIREYGRGRGMRYGTTYYGRGFVQLTWEANYRKASAVVGVDLVTDPDRALELPIASAILFDGMVAGWFTGKRLADFIHDTVCDYREARRIVNGTDRAETIAGYAVSFERGLRAADAAAVPGTNPLPPAPNSAVAEFGINSRPSRVNPTWVPVPLPRFAGKDSAAAPPLRPPDDPGAAPTPPEPAASGGFFHALVAPLTALFRKGKDEMTKIDPMGALMGAALHANPIAGMIGAIVADTLARPDVPLAKEHVGSVAAKVVDAVAAQAEAGGLTVVPVKSGWASKINWVQFAGPACSLLAAFGLDLGPDQLVGLVVAVQTMQSIVTWILRTWFTHAVTRSAVR